MKLKRKLKQNSFKTVSFQPNKTPDRETF